MKKLILSIAILLFAILLKLCSAGLDIAVLTIGFVGIVIAVSGFIDKSS